MRSWLVTLVAVTAMAASAAAADAVLPAGDVTGAATVGPGNTVRSAADPATRIAATGAVTVKSGRLVLLPGFRITGGGTLHVYQVPYFPQDPHCVPSPVVTTQAAVSVAPVQAVGDEAGVTYEWRCVSGPAAVVFAPNGTNAAKATTASFVRAGEYQVEVMATAADGGWNVAPLAVSVQSVVAGVTLTPSATTCAMGGSVTVVAQAVDQFAMAQPAPVLNWSVDGGGTITGLGVFRAKAAGTWTVSATASATVGAQTAITVAPAPMVYDRTYVCAANIGYYQRTIEATSPTNAAMTFTVTTAPQHGTLTIEGGTSFKYIPAANYVGLDSFQIAANDGTQGLPGTIRVNVGIDPARSPLVRMDAIEAFDPVKWANDPDYRSAYLANPNPARVWQTAQGGPGVPMLQIVGSPRVEVVNGGTAVIGVKTSPYAPVTFVSMGEHGFGAQVKTITVKADVQGFAQAYVLGTDRPASSVVVVGSALAAGNLRVIAITAPVDISPPAETTGG